MDNSELVKEVFCPIFLAGFPRITFALSCNLFTSTATGASLTGAGPSQLWLLQRQAESLQPPAWSLQSQAEPLSSREQAEWSPSQAGAFLSGRGQSRTSLLTPDAESATNPYQHMQCLDESQQSASGNTVEGLSFILDNGDDFEDGDTLRAFNTISQVWPLALLTHLQRRILPATGSSMYQHASARVMLCMLCRHTSQFCTTAVACSTHMHRRMSLLSRATSQAHAEGSRLQ